MLVRQPDSCPTHEPGCTPVGSLTHTHTHQTDSFLPSFRTLDPVVVRVAVDVHGVVRDLGLSRGGREREREERNGFLSRAARGRRDRERQREGEGGGGAGGIRDRAESERYRGQGWRERGVGVGEREDARAVNAATSTPAEEQRAAPGEANIVALHSLARTMPRLAAVRHRPCPPRAGRRRSLPSGFIHKVATRVRTHHLVLVTLGTWSRV